LTRFKLNGTRPNVDTIIFTVLMKRLDDVNDDVRLSTLSALSSLNFCLPPSAGSRPSPEVEAQLKSVCSTILLHMDDPNVDIRNAALGMNKAFLPNYTVFKFLLKGPRYVVRET